MTFTVPFAVVPLNDLPAASALASGYRWQPVARLNLNRTAASAASGALRISCPLFDTPSCRPFCVDEISKVRCAERLGTH